MHWKKHTAVATTTAQSSCQAETHSINECTKDTLHLRHIADDLGLTDTERPTRIWNDNQGAVDWSAGFSNRKMRHLNMRENLVRENGPAGSHNIEVDHVPGKCNFADNFTKEQKCNATFTASRDTYMCSLADGGCWKVSTPISNVE